MAPSGRVMTGLVLWVAFASVFCVLLGYTRVPLRRPRKAISFPPLRACIPPEFPVLLGAVHGRVRRLACAFSALESLIKALIVIQIVT